jgi:hypothetical protein
MPFSVRGRLALAAAGIVAAVVGAVILALVLDRQAGPPAVRSDGLSAEGFVDSIGVNVHFSYGDTAYARQPEVLSRLRELGVGHVRDAMANPSELLRSGLQASAEQGIRGTLLADPARDPVAAVGDSVSVMGDGIAAFEGPNEYDNSGDPAWSTTLGGYMPALAAAVAKLAPDVPVLGPTVIDTSNRAQLPADLPGLFNAHPYPGGGPPEPALSQALQERSVLAPRRGVVFTETGYHNALAATVSQPPASEEAAAIYLPRLFATAFGAGVRRTFIYELVDEKPDPGLVDPEQHFGLLRNDLSPKPAFTAIKTLIAAIRASPGPGAAGPLSTKLRVLGDGAVERLDLKREDGSRLVALWRPVTVWDVDARVPVDPGQLPVELNFAGRQARDVTVWRPSVATGPVQSLARSEKLEVGLEGDLVLVSMR